MELSDISSKHTETYSPLNKDKLRHAADQNNDDDKADSDQEEEDHTNGSDSEGNVKLPNRLMTDVSKVMKANKFLSRSKVKNSTPSTSRENSTK